MGRIHRRGFTLVELLIVIGIIVVLLSILVPAVGSAQKLAQRTTCQNNVRSLLLATQQYVVNDAESRLPYPNFGGATNGGPGSIGDDPTNPGWLYRWPNYGNTPDDMKTGTLWKYIQDERVYHCPQQNPQDPMVSSSPQPSINITSYIVNRQVYFPAMTLNKSAKPPNSMTRFRNPSGSILFFECAPYGQDVSTGLASSSVPNGYFDDGASFPTENSISNRHGAGTSVGFLDGHVEFYDLNSYQSALNQFPGPFYCNPDTATGQ